MIFIFENFWLLHEDFMQVMEFGWGIPNNEQDKAKRVGAKFKALRKVLRQWQSQILNLGKTIENSKTIISFLDILEKSHDLSLEEWNFRVLLQEHLAKLLEQQRVYWKQRGRIKWATLGDESTNFFHATAIVNHNRNSIMMLKDLNG
jgi:DNA-directed RNA polymerase sigma subunit (sigma70/sigma32)